MSIDYNFNISRDHNRHQRVTFGPYHQGKAKNIKLGLRLLETTTCWQKLRFVIQKYLLNRVVTLQDVNGLVVHIYRYKLNKCIVRYLKKNPKGGYAKSINRICKMAHPSSDHSKTTTIASLAKSNSSSDTQLTTIIHSSGDEANLCTKILFSNESSSSSDEESDSSSSESSQKEPSHPLQSSKGSGERPKILFQKIKSPKAGKSLLDKSVLKNKIALIAKHHFALFASTCFNKDGKVNNEVARRKALANLWGLQLVLPDTLRKKACEARRNALFLPEQIERLTLEANKLEERALELEKDFEDTIRDFQNTFFPCRIGFEDIEEDAFIEDASEQFVQEQVVYHGTSSESAARIRSTKIFLKTVQRELDSGCGVYFVKEKCHALSIAEDNKEANVITCKIHPIKTAYIKNQGALDSLISHFFQMAQVYTIDHEDQITKEIHEEGITTGKVKQHGKIMGDIQEHLCDRMVRLYFTTMGYDAIYSTSGGQYEDITYFNVVKPSEKNITILS